TDPTAPNATRRSSPRVKFFSTSFCSALVIWMPGGSKKRICTTSGSAWLVPTWTPASYPSVFRRCRATAAGSTRRSPTSSPADVNPEINARFVIRQAGGDSRLATTRAPPQRDAVRQHRVRADARARSDPAVVADVCGTFDLLELADLDSLAEPHVAANPNTGDVQANVLLERIEVRLAVLVEVADVLPVAVHREAVDRPSHVEQVREELLREVVRA